MLDKFFRSKPIQESFSFKRFPKTAFITVLSEELAASLQCEIPNGAISDSCRTFCFKSNHPIPLDSDSRRGLILGIKNSIKRKLSGFNYEMLDEIEIYREDTSGLRYNGKVERITIKFNLALYQKK